MSKKILGLLAIITILLVSCNREFNKVLKSKDFEYKLKKANEYYDAKKYEKAKTLYEELITVYKSSDKFESLYYKFAYSYYYTKYYKEAENLFRNFLEVFPNSKSAEEILFMEAYCFYKQAPRVELEQTNTNKTIGMMQTFINTYPTTSKLAEANSIIDQCRIKLEEKDFNGANLYYQIGQFKAAQTTFSNLLEQYPDSKKLDFYKFMSLKSAYEYANLSYFDKQKERYQKVIEFYQDFIDRFEESQYKKEVIDIYNLTLQKIKTIDNEQNKTPSRI